MNVEINSNGVNKLIKYNILSDERMKEIGFRECGSYWYFSRMIKFPKERRWRCVEISFNVHIPKDGSDLDIFVLDDDFGQPYDYQYLLSNNPRNECAKVVREEVEKWMKYLHDNGVLNGHVYGEYI